MRRRTTTGKAHKNVGRKQVERRGGKQRRFTFGRRAEELAASLGRMLRRRKLGRGRPLRTERGGVSRTRSRGANTRKWAARSTSVQGGRKLGLGRKRVRRA